MSPSVGGVQASLPVDRVEPGYGKIFAAALTRPQGWPNCYMTMKPKPKHPLERYQARARIAKALAHPSRLLMLDALADRELCVCELTELVGADQSTVSKHLAVLKQAGIVADRKKGPMTFYRLKVRCLQGFWECVEAVLKENLRTQQAAIEA